MFFNYFKHIKNIASVKEKNKITKQRNNIHLVYYFLIEEALLSRYLSFQIINFDFHIGPTSNAKPVNISEIRYFHVYVN